MERGGSKRGDGACSLFKRYVSWVLKRVVVLVILKDSLVPYLPVGGVDSLGLGSMLQ